VTKKKKKKSWKEKRQQSAIKHQKALEAERVRRERKPRKSKGWLGRKTLSITLLFLALVITGIYAAWQMDSMVEKTVQTLI